MPINASLMRGLQKRYGAKKGSDVYYGMEEEGKASFKKGLRTAIKEGHVRGLRLKKRKTNG
jgi:hypothetical protein